MFRVEAFNSDCTPGWNTISGHETEKLRRTLSGTPFEKLRKQVEVVEAQLKQPKQENDRYRGVQTTHSSPSVSASRGLAALSAAEIWNASAK